MFGFMQTSFFFGYMLLAAYAAFIMLGTIGFLSSFVFVLKICECPSMHNSLSCIWPLRALFVSPQIAPSNATRGLEQAHHPRYALFMGKVGKGLKMHKIRRVASQVSSLQQLQAPFP